MSAPLVLGRYTVGQFLGRGSMGQVFLAHRPDGSEVVIKFMHPNRAADPRFRELFATELQIMAGFHHPEAVRFLDGGVDRTGGPCIVMQYVPGIELRHLIRRHGRLDAERAAGLLLPLCRAINAAHEAGIIHRDLKPSNLMVVDPDGDGESLRVMDLGLAALTDQPYIPLALLRGGQATGLVGTRAYICPEQIRGDDMDERGDLYSIGVVLFEMLTGQLPFAANDQIALLEAHLESPPPHFRDLHIHDVPPRVEDLVHRLLAKYPNERPQNGYELAKQYCDAIHLKVPIRPADFLPRDAEPTPLPVFHEPAPRETPAGWRKGLKKLLGR
jgi:eukaryotic-like serine/threonine-protein kinase